MFMSVRYYYACVEPRYVIDQTIIIYYITHYIKQDIFNSFTDLVFWPSWEA